MPSRPRLYRRRREQCYSRPALHKQKAIRKYLYRAPNCALIILAMGLASLPGCDPVRTIRQSVTLAVVDDRAVPAPDVKVSIKESWESWQSWGGGIAESEKSYVRQRWENEIPWLKGVTKADGNVVIAIEITGLDSTKGNKPSPRRDVVSNREYIIKLDGQNSHDETRVLMKPGAVGSGKRYSVTINAIEQSSYVQDREEK